MTLTRREKILIAAGLIVVTAVLYILYFWIPYTRNMAAARTRLSQSQTQLSELNLKSASAAKLGDQIRDLNGQLQTDWASVPTGLDHARILLYLKQLTDGKAEATGFAAPNAAETEGPFAKQLFTADFNTTYGDLLAILGDLKKGELYCRVTLVKAEYKASPTVAESSVPEATPGASPSGTAGETSEPADTPALPAPTPSPTADPNDITVHMELVFYALQPDESASPAPAMTPTNTQRADPLMPN